MHLKKELQAKRKHHHVWANYLLKWSTNGRDLFCTTRKGNIDFTSVRGVVMEKDFYHITPLKQEHIDTILMFASLSSSTLQKEHQSNLRKFLTVQQLEETYYKSESQDQGTKQAILAAKCNLLENVHASYENDAAPILEALVKGNIDILKNDREMLVFTTYLGHQITRTRNFKVRCLAAVSKNNPNLGKIIESSWWFFSYMFGVNLGQSLYLNRHIDNHTLLVNNTNIGFITSDQPAINVHNCVKDEEFHTPESMDLFYPISPKYAFIITESHRFEDGLVEIDESNVIELNEKVAKNANMHIFSSNKKELNEYKSLVGSTLKTIKGRM